MNEFLFDDFQDIFISEVKNNFVKFIDEYRDKVPYIFVISAPDYIANNHPLSYCLGYNGNTIQEFQEGGYSFDTNNPEELYLKYCSEEWHDHSTTDNNFPKSNKIILNYIIENESYFTDDKFNYTDNFIDFRNKLFQCIITSLESLKNENYFKSKFDGSMIINFHVREFYDDFEVCGIFERLNTKQDLEEFKKWM